MTQPIIKAIPSDGCRSYLLGCPTTRACILVDPKVGCEGIYRTLIASYGFELQGVFDTHTHADHLSAATRFMDPSVPLYMSHATPVQRPTHPLRDGDELVVGKFAFHVVEVPGHTPDSLALFGHGLLLSGDSLFVGSLARADFIGSDPAQLFQSVTERLMTLPEGTLVYPGHDYNDILFTTIEHEQGTSEALQHASGAAYAASLNATPGAGNSAAVNSNLELNLSPDPKLPESAGNAAACCAAPSSGAKVNIPELEPAQAVEVHAKEAERRRWVDVRDPFEFEHGRIPDTRNIPLGDLGFRLNELKGQDPLYLSCRSGVRSNTAAKTLKRLGVAANPVNVGGGILAWQELGFPIEGQPST